MKLLNRNLPRLRFLAAIGITLILFTYCKSGAAAEKETVPTDLYMRWQAIRTQSADTTAIAGLLSEGDRVIQRLQELDALRRNPKTPTSRDYNQRVTQLRERFKDILYQIELARVSSLSDAQVSQMIDSYRQEQSQLEKDTRALEDSIIVHGDNFLKTYKQQISLNYYMSKQEMIVDFIYRIAEIYYRRGEDQYFDSNDIVDFKPALERYQRIIDEFPASEYVDDALYNIAYIKNLSQVENDKQEAITLYKTLIEKYHNSPFVPEAYWSVGEYYFYRTPSETDNARTYYTELLNYPDTPWYSRGMYKIGWCYFRESNYHQAIDYFTRTVVASLDSAKAAKDVLYSSMLEEAQQYISVCFAQDSTEWSGSGVQSAVAFVESDTLRRNTYGKRVIEYLGDIYKDQTGKYPQAIQVYTAYLELYPLDAKAPWIQEKIIKSYAVNLRDFPRSYEEKERLFTQYHSGTDWDKANPDSTVRNDANVIIEKYYNQNIVEAIGRGLQENNQPLLTDAIQMSKNYLEEFPAGPNAYLVNYNLAILLDQYAGESDAAFAEYIKVSKDYPDDTHRKDAAVNAVIIAKKLIDAAGPVPPDSLKGKPLSDPESKYVQGVDNYLSYFPQGEEAELFLLNAGAIYYKHGMYPESRQYYARLLSDFPEGQRRADAYKYIMNGYFAEGNYPEAEKVAKEIQSAGFDSTLVASAKTRQAESVFLNAEGIKNSGLLLAAAEEFRRAALETPDYAQADKALFESGLTFQEAKSWKDANEVYLLLVQRYPQSELADKALYNVGYNSKSELNDPGTAAATFERLAIEYPQSPLAQDALRNASTNYTEAENWAGSIRANTAYVAAFPAAPDAATFLFANAGLFLKLGDENSANEMYAAYAAKYPGDARSVRARWERGKYFQDKGRDQESYNEFSAGIGIHRQLVQDGKQGEETYASRCLIEVVHSDMKTYEAIQFAPASALEERKRTKLAMRDQLFRELEELNGFAKDEMLEGLYSLGKIDDDLSLTFAGQDLPDNGAPEEKIVKREEANQDAILISQRAMAGYAKAAEDIAIASQVLGVKMGEMQRRKEALTNWTIEAQKSQPQPPGISDSTVALAELDRLLKDVDKAYQDALDWDKKAQEKVPELAMRNAELKATTVKAFLDLPDVGKTDAVKMAYRSAVLSEFVVPRSAVVLQLYVEASDKASLSASADSWRSRAYAGINQTFDTINHEYHLLEQRSLDAYSMTNSTYQELLGQGEGATKNGLQAADLAERLVTLSTQPNEFALSALAANDSLMAALPGSEKLPIEVTSRQIATALEEVFWINENFSHLGAAAKTAKAEAQSKQAQSVVWEDAVMTFEDCAYNFQGRQEDLLNRAMEFNQSHGDDKAMAQRIGWALVEIDREKYLSILAAYGEDVWIRSDQTFLVNSTYQPNWQTVDFTETGWMTPLTSTSAGHEADELSGSQSLWSAMQPDSTIPDTLFLRKSFSIADQPVGGDLWITVSGGYNLQINNEYVGGADPGSGWSQTAHYDIAQILKSGNNVLAVQVVSSDSTNSGVIIALKYKVLPYKPAGGP
ncbi:MAG: tetratricopeptide repeat protein [bacterium]|nr:tetratricopeptide repeat protein [bacterium]